MKITTLYAESAHHKTLWANTRSPARRRAALECGRLVGNQMMRVPAQNHGEAVLKLTELLEWIAEDVTPDAIALLESCIEDQVALAERERRNGAQMAVDAMAPAQPAPQPRSIKVTPRIRRARPTTVDGVQYPSLTAAAVATGVSYSTLRKAA